MTIELESRKSRKATGSHYTPSILADFVAAQIAKSCDIANPTVLDPALGDGELLVSLVKALGSSRRPAVVAGYDTDHAAVRLAEQRLHSICEPSSVSIRPGDFLEVALENARASTADLFGSVDIPHYDIVIANPPYVRTQVMGAGEAQRIAALFGLTGRVDLYFAFLLGIAHVLKPGGVAGVIVSNRFMTTKAGALVRRSLRRYFDILHVWDLGDTKVFDAAVLPAVLLMKRRATVDGSPDAGFTSIYSSSSQEACPRFSDPFSALEHKGLVKLPSGAFTVQHGTLHLAPTDLDAVWRLASEQGDEWLSTVSANTHCTFGDIGKIRVGVKTTADKVFIGRHWSEYPKAELPELLRPLTTHHCGKRFRAQPPIYHIIYPHETVQGKRRAVDLAAYPLTSAYLNKHRDALESRRYVAEAGRKWFEIWVPQDPDAWALPKLVFRDISERPTFWIDLDGTVVNGDCYWLAGNPKGENELLWLALAVANSTFIEKFYDHRFNNKLYSGRRRFMTQYVEQFPLPDPAGSIARRVVDETRLLWGSYTPERELVLDRLVWEAFGVLPEE